MDNDFCEILPGPRIVVCTLGNGAGAKFEQFLEGLGEERQARVLATLERLSVNGTIENPEVFTPIRGTVNLFKIRVAGLELSCFRSGPKFVICYHVEGKLSPEIIHQTRLIQTQTLANTANQQK